MHFNSGLVPILPFQPEYTHVPFWYIPPCLRQCSDPEERRKRLAKVSQCTLLLVLHGWGELEQASHRHVHC